jgi:hypothetical protein
MEAVMAADGEDTSNVGNESDAEVPSSRSSTPKPAEPNQNGAVSTTALGADRDGPSCGRGNASQSQTVTQPSKAPNARIGASAPPSASTLVNPLLPPRFD